MDQLTWDMMPKRLQTEQAKHLVNKFKPLYKVNVLFVYDFGPCFIVINKDSFIAKLFDTKQKAVDYCLDNFKQIKSNEQLKLL